VCEKKKLNVRAAVVYNSGWTCVFACRASPTTKKKNPSPPFYTASVVYPCVLVLSSPAAHYYYYYNRVRGACTRDGWVTMTSDVQQYLARYRCNIFQCIYCRARRQIHFQCLFITRALQTCNTIKHFIRYLIRLPITSILNYKLRHELIADNAVPILISPIW